MIQKLRSFLDISEFKGFAFMHRYSTLNSLQNRRDFFAYFRRMRGESEASAKRDLVLRVPSRREKKNIGMPDRRLVTDYCAR